MATVTTTPSVTAPALHAQQKELTFREAMNVLSREERFMATVQAMNTLLIQKGIYSTEEMEHYYCQWAQAQLDKPKRSRPGWSRLLSWFL